MSKADNWVRFFRSDKQTLRLRAAKALVERPDTSDSILLEILDSFSGTDVAPNAIRRLSEQYESDKVSAMISRLSDDKVSVREAACEVLAAIGDASAITPLLDCIIDPQDLVRKAAARAIRAVGSRASLDELPELKVPYRPRKSIYEESDDFYPFPDPEDVFASEVELHSNHLLPIAAVDLSSIDKRLDGLVHFIQPFEPCDGVVGEGGEAYFTNTCRQNFVGYQYDSDRCRLMADFRYFELSRLRTVGGSNVQPALKCLSDHYADVRSGFERARSHYQRYRALHAPQKDPPFDKKHRIALAYIGGSCKGGNWEDTEFPLLPGVSTDSEGKRRYRILPLTDDGRPFMFIGQLASSAFIWSQRFALCCDLLLFYDPEKRVALTTFDWS